MATVHAQNSEATYSISYESIWSNTTHPHPMNNFPGNAHYSKLVGATHNENVTFLELGGIATDGIEDIAELGNNDAFFAEVTAEIGNGNANQIVDVDGLGTGTGTILIENVTTDENFPLLTMVSMLAPSPDWMIAASMALSGRLRSTALLSK